MAKIKTLTPAMAAYEKKNKGKTGRVSSLGRESWRRFCRNKTAIVGLVIVCILILCAIFADVIAPYGYQEQIYADAYQSPSLKHLFGTDNYGRDIFSRIVYGSRYSLSLAIACVFTCYLTGGVLGVVAGYFGGQVDYVLMRIMDMLQSVPSVLLAIAISASLGNGIPQMIIAITISSMPHVSKTCRAQILTVKSADYIESSRAIGVKPVRMIMRHMLPNTVGVLVIYAVGTVSMAIGTMASLSYLGIGISPPTPEWGLILAGSKIYFTSYSYMVLFPAGIIMLTVLALNMLGDGLRDAFDPRLK